MTPGRAEPRSEGRPTARTRSRPPAPAFGAVAGALVFLLALAPLAAVLVGGASAAAGDPGYAIATVLAGLAGGVAGAAAARRLGGGGERALELAAGIAGPLALSLLFALTAPGDPGAGGAVLRWAIPLGAGAAAAAGAAVAARPRG